VTLQEFRVLQVLSILTPRTTRPQERFVTEHAIAMQFDRSVNVRRTLQNMYERALVEKMEDPTNASWRIADKGEEVVNA
jgi:hypothetical protein